MFPLKIAPAALPKILFPRIEFPPLTPVRISAVPAIFLILLLLVRPLSGTALDPATKAVDAAKLPSAALVDYVRYFKRPE